MSKGHMHKRGTPTMGGVVIIFGALLGYAGAHFRLFTLGDGFDFRMYPFTPEGLLAVLAFVGMGFIGFLDDFAKYARKHNQGLSKRWKFLGQLAVAGTFAWGAQQIGVSTELSFVRPLGIDLGPILYFLLVLFMLTAAANAVNLTDGLDGLVAGSVALVVGAYVLIAFWQFRNIAVYLIDINGALDLARFAAAIVGAALGIPVVERGTGEDLHGGHWITSLRGRSGRPRAAHQHPTTARPAWRPVRGRDTLGDRPGLHVPRIRTPDPADGANPPSLRTQGVAGDDGDREILDSDRHCRCARRRSLLRRLPERHGRRIAVKTLILGAGVSGLAAAKLAARLGHAVSVPTTDRPRRRCPCGSKAMWSTPVHGPTGC